MWIERLEERMDRFTESVPHLPLVLAAVAAVIVAELVAFGWVTLDQVERSHQRDLSVATLRSNISQCYDRPLAASVDRCKARVLAEAGQPQPASPVPLPAWRGDDAPVVSAAGGLVPVSLVRTRLR